MPLDREGREELALALEEKVRRQHQRRYYELYPDETVLDANGEVASLPGDANVKLYARRLYPKHLEFYEAGKTYRERGAVCANRVGKTLMGSFEATAHLTGIYHHWWPGRVFTRPTRGWVAGKSNETTRDIVQRALLGEVLGSGPNKRLSGTGMIPGALLDKPKWKAGVADLVDTVRVKHASGGWSLLGFKAYEQGRGSFEGTVQDFIWPDEEPPMDVWTEMVTRTATTNGLLYGTFTPMEGMSETVMLFYPKEEA